MTLIKYLKAKTPAERKAFASSCGTIIEYLNHITAGRKQAGVSLAINIERESGGAVRCEELRPDVDWAYIRNSKPARRRAA
jgi:DNA-binding transcriptional regulator YdaS (Cro superfamily)